MVAAALIIVIAGLTRGYPDFGTGVLWELHGILGTCWGCLV